MQEKQLAVVAVSGGLDSCVTAAIANKDYSLALAHINYGQRTESKELNAFHQIADYFKAERRLVIDYSHLTKIGGSSLTDKTIDVADADLESDKVPSSYVPFRNASILTSCVSWAEVIGAKAIFMGAVFEDSSGYPDCRPDFFSAFQNVIEEGTKPETHIKIETPIIHMSKADIIKTGMDLKAPIHLTWSCYKEGEEACGVCDSCALRLRGFQTIGVEDPLNYETKPDYLIKKD